MERFNGARNKLNAENPVLKLKHSSESLTHTSSEGSAYVCYAAASNSFGIRSDGNLVKCTTALHEESNKIGSITESGELNINQALVKLWMGGFAAGKNSQLACPLYSVKAIAAKNQHKTIQITAI